MHVKMHPMLHAKIMKGRTNAFVTTDTPVMVHTASMSTNVPPEM